MEDPREGTAPGAPDGRPGRARLAVARDWSGAIVAWAVWLAMTGYLILFIGRFSRNVPFMDDFNMVPVMTGSVPVTLEWAWSQHHEHRPLIPRLFLAGLARFIDRDFRTARYANVGLLSAAAAAMLMVARSIRGRTSLTDAVLPLSILSIAQAESLMIGFAMNLVLTSLIAIALIAAAGTGHRWGIRGTATIFGASLVLLPLCGGSGLAMLPPLALWVAGYVACGWWSGRSPDAPGRSIGLVSLLAGAVIVNLYFHDYSHPSYHPPSTSLWTVAIGALKCLSLGLYPNVPEYWWPAGPILLAVLTPTVLLLVWVVMRTSRERPHALALMAILLGTLSAAVAVGVSRAGLGERVPVMSRYVTLTIPLLSTVYIAWLAYGGATARVVVPAVLLALIVSTLPTSHRFSREYGWQVRVAEQRVEEALKNRATTARVLEWACPPPPLFQIYPHSEIAHACFKMLKQARVGAFVDYDEGRVATRPEATGTVRR